MFTDNQIMVKPTCGCCNKSPALVFWRTTAVCGPCVIKLGEKEKVMQLSVIEEVQRDG